MFLSDTNCFNPRQRIKAIPSPLCPLLQMRLLVECDPRIVTSHYP